MRIALLHPTYWPEVRRGSERLIHDLAVRLSDRGHEVTILTSHPGRAVSAREDGVTVDRARRLPARGPLRWYEHHITASLPAFTRLVRGRFDLAQAFFCVDAWAALHARRFGGPPVVATTHGIPERAYLVKRRYRLEMHVAAAERAAEVTVLSRAAQAKYERYFGRTPVILPGGAEVMQFDVAEPKEPEPTIVCAASLGDPRKRGDLLFEAFARLRERVPKARLWVVQTPDPVMSGPIGRLPEGAELVEGDDTDSLARLYARSWLSVLPSVGEAFGLVLVESLMAGTPVVAARSGACPEIVRDERCGYLFEPDDAASLAQALEGGLKLGGDPAAAGDCRAAAAPWSWETVVERYEDVYERVLAQTGRASTAA